MMWNGTLAELAGFTESPTSDGVLGDWVRKRAAAPFAAADVRALVALLRAPDPHLQEAGVELATAALRTIDAGEQLEPHLAALASAGTDPYVLEALVELLEEHALPRLFDALAALDRATPAHAPPGRIGPAVPAPRADRTRFILRNRLADPWPRFRALAERRGVRT
jgi:hypothetical protein